MKNVRSVIKQTPILIGVEYLSAKAHYEVLEWMPHERFYDIKYLAKGGFGEVYKAKWKDGWIREWNDERKDWDRNRPNEFIALKSLFNSKDVKFDFINEITCHRKLDSAYIIKLYGITQDPESKNYMMVLEYAENGSLRNYLSKKNRKELRWKNKINLLHNIALGLSLIHENFIHRDLHSVLALKCIDLKPSNRPTAGELKFILHGMIGESENKANNRSELIKQIRKADKENKKNKTNKTTIPSRVPSSRSGTNSIHPTSSTYSTHSTYSSRIFTSIESYNDNNLESCQI
ncbi:kinase-like domain-containing protein [Rhizophagus irregularis DAOM 181602=DAOM 197198]|nr:kinase-like domain-containing protein [Rhizophagus irregularis DAOM 181602=DAOM 197198]